MNPDQKRSLPLVYSDPRESGTPILFVHGISHNRSVWEKLVGELPQGLRPISIDLRGHGESPWSIKANYDLQDYAADLPALLDHLENDLGRRFPVDEFGSIHMNGILRGLEYRIETGGHVDQEGRQTPGVPTPSYNEVVVLVP